jgi:Flp pilus assembly protein TadB
MSREERRNYERMMRNAERGPSLPPAAKARAERNAARRAARQPKQGGTARTFTARFLIMSTVIAVAVGYLAFSIVWPTMPFALYIGVIVAVVAFVIQVGLLLARRRIAPR